MTPLFAVKLALMRILDYKGRSSRADFWLCLLILLTVIIAKVTVDGRSKEGGV